MTVFSDCVNDYVHILYKLVFKKAVYDWLWFLMWLSHHPMPLVFISVLQRYNTYFSTSVGWYISIM